MTVKKASAPATPASMVEDLARFASMASFDRLSEEAVEHLKVRVLDSIGCALGSLQDPMAGPVGMVRDQVREFGPSGPCTLMGGGTTSPDRAALLNGFLVRYLDFNDSYLASGETCHPSDNLAPVLACAEYAGGDGRELMTALAVAYQVQCRLSDVAPVRARGFDHTTQGSFAVAAGASRALGLDPAHTANALAIAGTAHNALRVTRTGALSHWKGLAYPNTAFCCTHAAFLAMRGVTGPREVFEGNKGFMDSISGPFDIDWASEDLERVTRTILKKYNAEVHSQSALEATTELAAEHGFTGADVEAIEVEVFDVAWNIIGGGEEGDKYTVRTKEEADHSLQYMVAAAVLDGTVMPVQYRAERIIAEDVQALMRKVRVTPSEEFTALFPDRHACRVTVTLKRRGAVTLEKRDYEGFHTRPMSVATVEAKFDRLAGVAEGRTDPGLAGEIKAAVRGLETIKAKDLAGLLGRAGAGSDD